MINFILIFGPGCYLLNVITAIMLQYRSGEGFRNWQAWVFIALAPIALFAAALVRSINK